MTKQEVIREGITDILIDRHRDMDDEECAVESDVIIAYLHSQGVVIKVGNKLPTISYHSAYPENEERYQQAMLDAGYEAVESFIKEE